LPISAQRQLFSADAVGKTWNVDNFLVGITTVRLNIFKIVKSNSLITTYDA
jgi:hypothetical protein